MPRLPGSPVVMGLMLPLKVASFQNCSNTTMWATGMGTLQGCWRVHSLRTKRSVLEGA